MSTGYGEGEGRVKKAIEDALNSPLLNDNDVFNSKKILLSIAFSSERKDNTGLTMDEMNDVNDFMGNFGDDFELKWGLAIDPELGNKVKVTVLATGFGIEDVDGMNVHLRKHTEEETRRIAEQEEKRAEREDRRKHYYGSDGNTPQYKRHPHIFLFRPEDLDNEDVIMQVEDTPTYKRTRQMLEDIRHIASGQQERRGRRTSKGRHQFRLNKQFLQYRESFQFGKIGHMQPIITYNHLYTSVTLLPRHCVEVHCLKAKPHQIAHPQRIIFRQEHRMKRCWGNKHSLTQVEATTL